MSGRPVFWRICGAVLAQFQPATDAVAPKRPKGRFFGAAPYVQSRFMAQVLAQIDVVAQGWVA